jgi:hypothetical protein
MTSGAKLNHQVDETDRVQDNHSKKAVKRNTTAAVMRKSSR